MTPVFARAAASTALVAAYDALIGPGRWVKRVELGTVPVRFRQVASRTTPAGTSTRAFPRRRLRYRVSVSSRDRGLLALFLISDVDEDDAPTRIRVGSHADVPRFLEPHGDDGVDMFTVCAQMDRAGVLGSPDRTETLATGAAGDVFLCHPFLIHAAQVNHTGRPRLMSQPGIMLREQFDLGHPTSPVELAIVDALADGNVAAARGVRDVMQREHLVPGPDHPITVEPTAGHVTVRIGDTVIAESDNAVTLREAG